jgi:quercetin dioxygenase-like cupin family protein
VARGVVRAAALGWAGLASAALAQDFSGPLPQALCAGWQDERTCELLHEDAMIRVLRCTFAPGVGHEAHYHPPHFGYTLEGESVMRITTAEGVADRPVRAGGAFANDAEVRHEALNVGEQATRYLIVEKKYADARAAEFVAAGLCAAEAPAPR